MEYEYLKTQIVWEAKLGDGFLLKSISIPEDQCSWRIATVAVELTKPPKIVVRLDAF